MPKDKDIKNIVDEIIDSLDGRVFYVLKPTKNLGQGADELYKIGEATGMDAQAVRRRIAAINNGTRPGAFEERGWNNGQFEAARAWVLNGYGCAKEVEHVVQKALPAIGHERLGGSDYFLGNIDEAIQVSEYVIEKLASNSEEIALEDHAVPNRRGRRGAAAGQDPWGNGTNTGAHLINLALIETERPLTVQQLDDRARRLGDNLGVEPRRAVRQHLAYLRDNGFAQRGQNGWKATDRGRKTWGDWKRSSSGQQ
ncbi:MAG: hypothetical protein Kow0020_12500 [Wenzhouxiangellaceae bacterium]